MIKFSCLISCYFKDKPQYLYECLDSIVSQTLKPTELILVEDGPLGQELSSIISEFEHVLPIRRIKIKNNVGLGEALNVGLKKCSYEIVCRMDTDDIAMPDRFAIQVPFLENNPNIDILGSWVKDIDATGIVIKQREYPLLDKDIKRLIWANPIIHPSVAFRKSSIIKIGSYNGGLKRRQDYDLWLRAAKEGLTFQNLDNFLLLYRFTPDYYNKNGTKVAYEQVKMAWFGLRGNKDVGLSAYVFTMAPLFRSIMPRFMVRWIHQLMDKFDPRRK